MLEALREKHPRFTYESFETNKTDGHLHVHFRFLLEPDISFAPQVSIPVAEYVDQAAAKRFAFHLGLVETISYWKAACSPELVVNAGSLTEQQVSWWHDLFTHGLGEFFFRNNIDFTQPDFLSIVSGRDQVPPKSKVSSSAKAGDLITVGGGKDSAVTLETLRHIQEKNNVLLLNPTKAALKVVAIAGFTDPLIVKRTIDPKLLQLNEAGYLNGHTPFSAYLAFLGIFVGALHDYQHLIASNERSASEGSVMFHGVEVNHQYSKSLRFEKLFRDYCAKYLDLDIRYFSFLRPLYELQIAGLFAQHPEYTKSFVSCNVNQGESWCGGCAKCAFVYLSLFPFLDDERRGQIFGEDYFEREAIQHHITDLVGLGKHKPFDCVGTEEESVLAVSLAIEKYQSEKKPMPTFLLTLKDKLGLSEDKVAQVIEGRLKGEWSDDHFLPPEYATLLRERIAAL